MHESFLPVVLSLGGAALCVALGLLVMARAQRLTVHWALATALTALAVTQFGNGMSLLAESGQDLLYWRRVALVGEILMPLGWLAFSVAFARSNASELLEEWKPTFLASGILTLLFLGFVGSDRLFGLAVPDSMTVRLGPTGHIYAALYLMVQAVILANLEQTLRHAGDLGRWYMPGFHAAQQLALLVNSPNSSD